MAWPMIEIASGLVGLVVFLAVFYFIDLAIESEARRIDIQRRLHAGLR